MATITEKRPDLDAKIDELIIKYRYAGRGSVSWSAPKIDDSDEKDPEDDQDDSHDSENNSQSNFTKEDIQNLIIKNTEINPFESEIKPNITNVPALNKCEWLRDDLLKMEYVFTDKSQLIEENYQIKEIKPTRRATVLARINNSSIILEGRANFNKAKQLHGLACGVLDLDYEILDFTFDEVNRIKDFLNAQKKSARHKMAAGDYDTVEVTASPILDDLDNSEEYGNLSGNELRKAMYKFNYTTETGAQKDVTMYISNRGSIWFVSEVPEEVVEHVFSGVKEIKGL